MDNAHRLARPSILRILWVVFAAVLAATLVAGAFVDPSGHAGIAGTFGFGAWYGFVACASLIVFAKALGLVLKRPDSYYGGRADE